MNESEAKDILSEKRLFLKGNIRGTDGVLVEKKFKGLVRKRN